MSQIELIYEVIKVNATSDGVFAAVFVFQFFDVINNTMDSRVHDLSVLQFEPYLFPSFQ